MPTILRIEGLRIVVYSNDHPPVRVHVRSCVLGPGWVVVINLLGPEVREIIGCDEREARGFSALGRGSPGSTTGRMEAVPWLN